MANYLVRRLIQAIPLILVVSIICFLIMHMMPGGPLARIEANPKVLSHINLRALAHHWGIDKPLWTQYGIWLRGMFTGDWGYSFVTFEPATNMILRALGPTLWLLGSSTLLTVILGVPLGIFQAVYSYTIADYILTFLSFVFFSFPTFFLALLLLLIFAVKLQWFPAGGMLTPAQPFSLVDFARHLVLPMTTLTLVGVAGYARFTRTSMLDTLGRDYIRTARSKGIRQRKVIWKHATRNAMIPVINIFALNLAFIFSGAVITEYVYQWPGMGTLFISSVRNEDYNVLLAILFISGVLVVAFNIIADIGMAFVDPRISYS